MERNWRTTRWAAWAAAILVGGSQVPARACSYLPGTRWYHPTMRVRVELVDVTCRRTEDFFNDQFYVRFDRGEFGISTSCGDRVGIRHEGRTSTMSIGKNQTRSFPDSERLLFEGDVMGGGSVQYTLNAFDRDWPDPDDLLGSVPINIRGFAAGTYEFSQPLRGSGADYTIRYRIVSLPSPGWSVWESHGVMTTSDPVVGENADGRLQVFWRGTDGAIYHNWQLVRGGAFSDAERLGGNVSVASNIAVGQNADGRLELFWRGADGALYHNWQLAPNSLSWSHKGNNGERLGGTLTSDPAVGRNADGRLEVFWRGPDYALWHRWQIAPNSGWSHWGTGGERLDGYLTSNIAVGRNADGRLELFVRGSGNRLYHRWQVAPNSGWSAWGSLDGVITSDPTVAQHADGRLEVFVRGTDYRLYHKWQVAPNSVWTPVWESPNGAVAGTVAVGRHTGRTLEVFARWTDGSLRSVWQVN